MPTCWVHIHSSFQKTLFYPKATFWTSDLRNTCYTGKRVGVRPLKGARRPGQAADNGRSNPGTFWLKSRRPNQQTINHGPLLVRELILRLSCFSVSFQLCEFALRLSGVAASGGTVSMATRRQVLATWVQIKRLLQQPVSQMKDIGVEVPTLALIFTR